MPAPLLTLEKLSFSYATQPLFTDLTLGLNENARIGLLGHNGSGKSTLLRILARQLEPTDGTFTFARTTITSQVEQDLPKHLLNTPLHNAMGQALPPEERDWSAWKIDKMLATVGFPKNAANQPTHELSGGQQTRLMLGRALLREPNLLLLDEPSNHLDLPTLLWLETFLTNWNGALLTVSHDRRFLDQVTSQTWILRDHKIRDIALPCSEAIKALQDLDEAAQRQRETETKEINRLKSSAKRLATWGKTFDSEGLSQRAKAMERRVQRLEDAQSEQTESYPWNLSIAGDSLRADFLAYLKRLPVCPGGTGQGEALYTTPERWIRPGDRIAVLGPNGGGKSSLLGEIWRRYLPFRHAADAAANRPNRSFIEQDPSAPLRFHPSCRIAYYDQSLRQLPDHAALPQGVQAVAERLGLALPEGSAVRVLAAAGFAWERFNQTIASLSGGERSRLLLVSLSLADAHIMMLDEPTNHLDMAGRDQLTEQLATFPGAVLLVTHDRELIEKACNRFWVVVGAKLYEVSGADEAYDRIANAESRANATHKKSAPPKPAGDAEPAAPPLPDNLSEDDLLTHLIDAEARLKADLARRPNRQSPHIQQRLRTEIAHIQKSLGF